MTRPVSRATSLAFFLTAIFVTILISTDQYISSVIPNSLWAKFGMITFPYKMTAVVLIAISITSIIFHLLLKAPDAYILLIISTLIALQTNGIKLGGIDLIALMPFIVILFVFAESLRLPNFQIVLPGVMFFGLLLILLDIPYITANHIYPPGRFIINFLSLAKGVLVAFIFVNLIRSERYLAIAIQAFLIVAFISALIGIGQIALVYFMGITINFASEAAEWKPNFLGLTLRATGLTTWPSWLADFSVLALPIMLFRCFNATSLLWRTIYLIGLLVLLSAIFLTLTYAAWFGAVLIFAAFPFLYWPQKSLHFIMGLLLIGALLQITGGIDWAYEHGLKKITTSTGMVERKVYLLSTLNEIIRDPWIGSGIYAEENFSENSYRKRAHNTGLQAWAALGLPGLLVFVTMMLVMLTQLGLMSMSSRGTDRQLFQALTLGILVMILEMFAEPNLTAPVTWFYLGLCQAAILVYCTERYPRPLSRVVADSGK